ncbi:hypothetical protein [Desulfovibrio gilichinskyi]|uniref:Uncharacterized protein n=1 Tax=Desulfovibrio gilichinskyi TaxID=1519643 RepID=A0A1X7D6W3_9BACT|nr:hypothetical protein [Desulfovibrio gilichinskyi]SMF09966.1 hypothetical protein SAMN06295933_1736 [Desulfovibrio gilichinskyi]
MNDISNYEDKEKCKCSNCFFYHFWNHAKNLIVGFSISSLKYLRFTTKRYRIPIFFTVLALAALLAYMFKINKQIEKDMFSASFISSAFISFAALVFTLFTTVKDWHQSFKKYMNITFFLGEEIVMRIENVPLTGEADIRQYGQQVGSQAATPEAKGKQSNPARLMLFPRLEFNSELQRRHEKTKYEVQMHLREKPKKLLNYEVKKNSKHYILWDILSKEGIIFQSLKKPLATSLKKQLRKPLPRIILEQSFRAAMAKKR